MSTEAMPATTPLLSLDDCENLARQVLSAGAQAYFGGGAGDEVTLQACRQAFRRLRLRPRIPDTDITDPPDTAVTVLGTRASLPVLIAPVAYQALAHPDAECAIARAAARAGTVMIASINSSRTMEEIAAAAGPLWQQMYLTSDEGLDRETVSRVEACGARAIVLTVDRPVYGSREREQRAGFQVPAHARGGNSGRHRNLTARARASWAALDWLLETTRLPVAVKGILTGADAAIAADHGAAAVIVSNHGGRQLDGAITALEALPEVAETAGGRCEVYVDGGVRRGGDVIKALALGARAVLVGRPVVWGLAAGGEAGAAQVLQLLEDEVRRDMTLFGVTAVSKLDRSFVTSSGASGVPEGARA
jgi:isopentenyl diphosphate isomerase/L-lactate dehydrogenase-like FMN-dependent dehydrogenase